MARAPFRRKSGAREANQLVRLAEGLASSKSRAEDVYWERELEAAVMLHLRRCSPAATSPQPQARAPNTHPQRGSCLMPNLRLSVQAG